MTFPVFRTKKKVSNRPCRRVERISTQAVRKEGRVLYPSFRSRPYSCCQEGRKEGFSTRASGVDTVSFSILEVRREGEVETPPLSVDGGTGSRGSLPQPSGRVCNSLSKLLEREMILSHTVPKKSNLCIPGKGIARPQSQFLHTYIHECRNWEAEHYNSGLVITRLHTAQFHSEPDIYIGFSTALHLQCRRQQGRIGSFPRFSGGRKGIFYSNTFCQEDV